MSNPLQWNDARPFHSEDHFTPPKTMIIPETLQWRSYRLPCVEDHARLPYDEGRARISCIKIIPDPLIMKIMLDFLASKIMPDPLVMKIVLDSLMDDEDHVDIHTAK